jgi:hypothetical protein
MGSALQNLLSTESIGALGLSWAGGVDWGPGFETEVTENIDIIEMQEIWFLNVMTELCTMGMALVPSFVGLSYTFPTELQVANVEMISAWSMSNRFIRGLIPHNSVMTGGSILSTNGLV